MGVAGHQPMARTGDLRTNRPRPNELLVSPLPCIAVLLALGGLLVTAAKPDQNRQFDFTGVLDLNRRTRGPGTLPEAPAMA